MKLMLGAIAVLLPAAAFAGMTGDELLRVCSAPAESVEHRDCAPYIQGAIDAAAVTARSFAVDRGGDRVDQRLFCIGRDEPADSVVLAVMRYLENHPENRASSAASNAILAMIDAYPCPKGGNALAPLPERRQGDRDSAPKP